jgi:hypothetical protein
LALRAVTTIGPLDPKDGVDDEQTWKRLGGSTIIAPSRDANHRRSLQ